MELSRIFLSFYWFCVLYGVQTPVLCKFTGRGTTSGESARADGQTVHPAHGAEGKAVRVPLLAPQWRRRSSEISTIVALGSLLVAAAAGYLAHICYKALARSEGAKPLSRLLAGASGWSDCEDRHQKQRYDLASKHDQEIMEAMKAVKAEEADSTLQALRQRHRTERQDLELRLNLELSYETLSERFIKEARYRPDKETALMELCEQHKNDQFEMRDRHQKQRHDLASKHDQEIEEADPSTLQALRQRHKTERQDLESRQKDDEQKQEESDKLKLCQRASQ